MQAGEKGRGEGGRKETGVQAQGGTEERRRQAGGSEEQ